MSYAIERIADLLGKIRPIGVTALIPEPFYVRERWAEMGQVMRYHRHVMATKIAETLGERDMVERFQSTRHSHSGGLPAMEIRSELVLITVAELEELTQEVIKAHREIEFAMRVRP